MMVEIFFYDSIQFVEEEVEYQHVLIMQKYLQEHGNDLAVARQELMNTVAKVTLEMKEALVKEREKQLAQVSVQEAQEDVSNMFNDLTDGLKDQLHEIKEGQAQLHDELLIGDEKNKELQEGL